MMPGSDEGGNLRAHSAFLLAMVLLVGGCRAATLADYETVPHVQSVRPIELATAVDSAGIHLLWASADQGVNYQYRDADSEMWSEPEHLSSEAGSQLHILDSDSTLHLFWIDTRLRYLRSSDSGDHWQLATERVPLTEFRVRDLAALDGNSALHLLVTTDDQRVLYLRSNDEGRHWTRPLELASSDVYRRTAAALTLDQQGTLYAIWAEVDLVRGGFSRGSLFCRKGPSEGNIWGETVAIYSQENIQIAEPVVAAMADRLFVVWNGGGGSLPVDLYWQTSHDEGAHWNAPGTMTRGWPGGGEHLQSCGSGSLCLLWIDKRHAERDWWYKIPVVGDIVWGLNTGLDPVWENNDLYLLRNLEGDQWTGEQRLTEKLSYVHAFDTVWRKEGLYVFYSGKQEIHKKVDTAPSPHQIYWDLHTLSK